LLAGDCVSHEWRRVAGRGRVFANDDRTEIVAAVFAGDWTNDEFSGEMRPETPPGPMWSWYMPILGAFGADGRPVPFQCKPTFGCQWGNYDRLSWVTLGPAVLSILDTPTVATTLNKFGGEGRRLQPPVRGAAPPPVVLQMVADNATAGVWPAMGSRIAYSVANTTAHAFRLTINANNLHRSAGGDVRLACAGEPPRYRWHLGCILPKTPAISLLAGQQRSVQLGAGAVVATSFVVNVSAAVARAAGGVGVVEAVATGAWGGGSAWEEKLSLNFVVASDAGCLGAC